jgi:V8-like Glu-specific endopeptidase
MTVYAMDVRADLCLLYSEKAFSTWLDIAIDEPYQDDEVTIIGYPLGTPVQIPTKGWLAGTVKLGETDVYMLSCPAFAGNSGGPVLNNRGEVVGVLIQGIREYPQVTLAAPLPAIRAFIEASFK